MAQDGHQHRRWHGVGRSASRGP